MGGTQEPIRVLHVDDEPDLAEMTATFLERDDERFTVETATSASEALDHLTESIDCIVSDYDMPGKNGIELLETVRESYPDLPFILFTGKGSEEVASDAVSAGVTDYLQKERGTDQYTILSNRISNAVSARRAALDADRTRQHLDQILKTVPACVVHLNLEGEFILANERAVEVLGLERTAVTDRTYNDPEWNIRDLDGNPIPDEELPFRQVRDSGEPLYGYRHTIVWPDGTQKTLLVNGAPLFDDNGNVESVVFSLSDITEQTERDRRLQRTTARLSAIFEESPDMINVHDMEGNIMDPNTRLCEETGYSETELSEMKVWEIDQALGEDEARALWAEMELGERRKLEGEYQRQDGSTVPTEIHISRLEMEGEARFVVISRDITERKERKRELERYEAYLQESTDVITVIDESGILKYQSPSVTRILGYEPGELVGENGFEYVHPDDLEDVRATFTDVVSDPTETLTVECRFRTADDEWLWLEIRGTNQFEHDAIGGIVTNNRDISERKEREQALEREREVTQQALDALTDLFYVFDEAGQLQRWNERVVEVTGYSNEELTEMSGLDFFPEDEQGRIAEVIEETLSRGKATAGADLRTKSGERIPYEFTGARLTDTAGNLIGLVGIGRDISERMHREQMVRDLQSRTEELIRASTREEIADIAVCTAREALGLRLSGVHLVDDDREVLEPIAVTDEVRELLGEAPAYNRTNPARTTDRINWEIFEAGETVVVEDIQEDTRIPVSDTPSRSGIIHPLGDHGLFIASSPQPNAFDETDVALTEILAAIVTAALDRAEREQTLRTRAQRLETQKERLDQFAGIVSHDLRNPLNVAEGRVELAREEADSEHLDAVERAHQRIRDLIDNLLTLAREGNTVEEMASVELADSVEASWENVETGEATLVVETDRSIRADQSRFKQLMENLIHNAIDHGDATVTVTVGVTDDSDGFYVADDGPGIPADEREVVFQSGYSTSENGTGFGLAIAKEIAQAHGWEIRATDSKDGGTRLEIINVEFDDH